MSIWQRATPALVIGPITYLATVLVLYVLARHRVRS